MKRYELLLFDFDGTLVDTAGDIAHHANAVLAENGLPTCTVDQVKDAIGFGVHELFKGIAPFFSKDPASLEMAVTSFRERYRKKPVLSTVPFPQVRETLGGPLKNITKAIITNKPQDITLAILETLGLQNYFERVIGMHAGHPPKPDPTSTKAMMERFQKNAQHVIYIGDSNVDAETCENAGIDFAWVDYGYDRLRDHVAKFQFSSASEWRILSDAALRMTE